MMETYAAVLDVDQVTLGSGLTINQQSFGVATSSSGIISGFDGLLGIAPKIQTQGSLSTNPDAIIPTVTDNLFSQGRIPVNSVGIYFQPATSTNGATGELAFGGINPSRIAGSMTFTPVTSTSPSSDNWGINQSIQYGSSAILSSAGTVDTGTALVYIASDAFRVYKRLTGAVLDNKTGLLQVTPTQYAALKTMTFNIGGTSFSFSPNAQLWPRSLNSIIGGSSSGYYLVINDLGTDSGEGLDFINGYTFLERFYSYYDTTNHRVGFANTAFTNAMSN